MGFLDFTTKEEFFQWFVAFRNPKDIWNTQPTYLIIEYVFYASAFFTLLHALRRGGIYPWLWVTCIFHGFVVEGLSYLLPGIDNFWHGQASLMFLGKRLPGYIITLSIMLIFGTQIAYEERSLGIAFQVDIVYLYTAVVAVSHMKIKKWAEPFAVGLSVVLLDIPLEILGLKFVHWTWHDTDPNIDDRHYWAPWMSMYGNLVFAFSFSLIFHTTHRLFSSRYSSDTCQSGNFFIELLCSLLTGLLSMPLGILQILALYHPLHDNCQIHTEVCICILLALYAFIVWIADRHTPNRSTITGKLRSSTELLIGVVLYYFTLILMVYFGQPENVISNGIHEPIGPCNETVDLQTLTGKILQKKKYLCLKSYDEGYMDFHCVDKPPKTGESWYTVCGTSFPNHLEYICVVWAFCFFGLGWFWQLFNKSGTLSLPVVRKTKTN